MVKNKKIDKHPSYGMIRISHIHSNGMPLFGSSIKHENFVELEIKRAEREKSKYHDHYYGGGGIIRIYLSPVQFTEMLTRTNTECIPCTINWTEEEGYIDPPKERNIKNELFDDLKGKFKELDERVKILKDKIDEDLKGPVNKATKEKIKFNVMKIHQDIDSNLAYLLKCQYKKLEDVGIQIIAEAEATVNGIIRQAGLEAIQAENKRLAHKAVKEDNQLKITNKIKRIIKR